MVPPLLLPRRVLGTLISATSLVVFAFLDLLDCVLCQVYRLVDELLEQSPIRCYCCRSGEEVGGLDGEISETLRERRNLFRGKLSLGLDRGGNGADERGESRCGRWSDCGCESCLSWRGEGEEEKLHLVTNLPIQGLYSYIVSFWFNFTFFISSEKF